MPFLRRTRAAQRPSPGIPASDGSARPSEAARGLFRSFATLSEERRTLFSALLVLSVGEALVLGLLRQGSLGWSDLVVVGLTVLLCAPFFQSCLIRSRNRRLESEARLRREFHAQSCLRAMSETVQGTAGFRETLERFLDLLLSTAYVPLLPKAALFLFREGGALELAAQRGLELDGWWELSAGEGRCPCGARVCPAGDEKPCSGGELPLMSGGHGCLAVSWRGEPLGVLSLHVSEGHPWTEDERFFLQCAADILGRFVARRRSADRLRESESLHRGLVENAPGWVAVLDAEGVLLHVNAASEGVLGRCPRELVGSSLFDLFTEEDQAQARRSMQAASLPEGARPSLWRVRRADGAFRWLEAVVKAFDASEGRRLAVYTRDVTERVEAENACRRLSAVVEQAEESMLFSEADGTVRYANPAFGRITGHLPEEVVGRRVDELQGLGIDEAFFHVLRDAIKRCAAVKGRIVSRRKDGSCYEEDVVVSPVLDERGAAAGYAAVRRDVTSQLRLEERLRQAEKMEGIGMLAGGVAHDFNNLLTLIMGYDALICDGLDSKSPLMGFARAIRKATDGAAAMTRQLLAFSRRQVIAPRVMDFNAMVTDTGRMLRRLVRENIRFIEDLQPGLWLVRADPGQMEQVLLNLVVNARDAMPKGGRLTLSTANLLVRAGDGVQGETGAPPGEYAALSVKDTGVGMDAGLQEHIFEPFFTTKEMGKGTGLGLATVYGVVKQNGGHILVESQPGRGSTFTIILPRVVGEAASPARAKHPVRGHGGHETVLVVEDSNELRRLIERTLRDDGYKVLHAASAEEALRIADAHEGDIDLLLTDIVLPGMSGTDLVRALSEKRPTMKVLCMSGYAWGTGQESLPSDSVLLHKPFDGDTLLGSIRQALV